MVSGKYQWISVDPPILLQTHLVTAEMNEYLPEQQVIRLIQPYWHHQEPGLIAELKKGVRPEFNDRVILLANTEEHVHIARRHGFEAIFCHHNCLCDESLFSIGDPAKRQYDGVMVARRAIWKRHTLAATVQSLVVVAVEDSCSKPETQAYGASLEDNMPYATFSKPPNGWRMMSPQMIRDVIQTAHVGLILSPYEGGSYVFGEYQLCGLPVVSTYAPDGRVPWADPEFCRFVPAEPAAVEAAVSQLVEQRHDPVRIRTRIIAKAIEHRDRLVELIETLCLAYGNPRDLGRGQIERLLRFRENSWLPLNELSQRFKTGVPIL